MAAPTTKANRQLSVVAASPPTRRGATIPPRLTDTSPSVMATVRRSWWASESGPQPDQCRGAKQTHGQRRHDGDRYLVAVTHPEPGDRRRDQPEANNHRPARAALDPGGEQPSQPSADGEGYLMGPADHVRDVLSGPDVAQGGAEYRVEKPESGQRLESGPREAVSTVLPPWIPLRFPSRVVHVSHTTTIPAALESR